MEIRASIKEDMDVTQLNREMMDRENYRNQNSIPTNGANVPLWNYMMIRNGEFAVFSGVQSL